MLYHDHGECYDRNKHRIERLIDHRLERKLQPTFFDVLFNEIKFKSAVENEVGKQLPRILSSRGDEYIRPWIRTPLADLINNNMYIQNALKEQADNFQNSLTRQRDEFKGLQTRQREQFEVTHERHVQNLKQSTDALIESSIQKVADSNYVIGSVRSSLMQEFSGFKSSFMQEFKDIQSKHDDQIRQLTNKNEELTKRFDKTQTLGIVVVCSIGSIAGLYFSNR
jgi:hypothetical protein